MFFVAEQLEQLRPTREQMLHPPFLLGTRDGTIPIETFANWLHQDHPSVEAAIPIIAFSIPQALRRTGRAPLEEFASRV